MLQRLRCPPVPCALRPCLHTPPPVAFGCRSAEDALAAAQAELDAATQHKHAAECAVQEQAAGAGGGSQGAQLERRQACQEDYERWAGAAYWSCVHEGPLWFSFLACPQCQDCMQRCLHSDRWIRLAGQHAA